MPYLIESIGLVVCWWDIPALIIFVAVVVGSGIKLRKAKIQERRLEEQLANIYADKTIGIDSNL